MNVRHEQHDCDMSAIQATRVRHERRECDTSAIRFDNVFDNDTSKNIFLHPYIYYKETSNFILRTTL